MNDSTHRIHLGHGAGGRLTHELIGSMFMRHFGNPILLQRADAGIIGQLNGTIALTTDSFVVRPLFFPGGDIGKLAVCGTVNDLAVCGARPAYITAGFIIEEGFGMNDLERIVASMAAASSEAGAMVAAGDTKVVEHGTCDGVFINTAGIGVVPAAWQSLHDGSRIAIGDKVIVSGPIADHGMAVLAARNEMGVSAPIVSDCAPLNGMIHAMLERFDGVKFMRDATRGGLAAVLCEIAEKKPFGVIIDERRVPVRDATRAMCDMLGFDPMHVANEGTIVIFIDARQAHDAAAFLRSHRYGGGAAIIGEVTGQQPGMVRMRTAIGGMRIIDMPEGELLPRIC